MAHLYLGVSTTLVIQTEEAQCHVLYIVWGNLGNYFGNLEMCIWHLWQKDFLQSESPCNRKAQVASVQSFTLWQQATIEITLLLLVHTTCIWVLFLAHIWFVVNGTFIIMLRGCNNLKTCSKYYVNHFNLFLKKDSLNMLLVASIKKLPYWTD